MQSFLQHRRIGHRAQVQVERDLEKARLLTIGGHRVRSREEEKIESDDTEAELADSSLAGDKELPAQDRDRLPNKFGSDTNGETSSPSKQADNETEQAVAASEAHHDEVDHHHLARLETIRTQYTARGALAHTLTGIHARDRLTHEGNRGEKVFVVGFEDNADPTNPRNWPLYKRIACTIEISLIALALCAASASDAAILPQAAVEFGVSDVVESLATGIFLIGFGLGSLLAGPFSETFGRNAVYMASLAIFMIWIMGAALAPNIGAQLAFRFLAGLCASAPLVCSGGSVSDMFNGIEKTWAFPLYAIPGFSGPTLGPVISSYFGPSPLLSWRWSEWICMIMAALVLIVVFFSMPETYAPLLLQWKASHLREITGDNRFRSEHEITDATLFTRLRVAMTRPFLMITEPIIALMTLYLTVIYIVLFTFLDGYTYIFQYTYGISQGLTNVIFVGLAIGIFVAFLNVPIIYSMTLKELARVRAEGGTYFHPEIRLWYAMFGAAPAIPISLFWMGWTARQSISIWSPIMASGLFGYGVIGVFLSSYMYVIDSYEVYSASALTFVALVRYLAAGGMTVAGIPFYGNMGVPYTLTIMACIAAACTPIPYVLYKYGHHVRKRSRFAVSQF